MDMSDFAGMDSLSNNVTAPPNRVKPIKPTREDLYEYYHNGLVPPKPLPKRYSYSKIKKILEEEYELVIWDTTNYKDTRWYSKSPRKTYSVYDKNGNTIIENGYLYDIGKYLEAQGDYVSAKDIYDESDISNRYKACVYYVNWSGKPNHFKPHGKFMRDVFVEERGCFFYFYDEDGNYLLKKKKGSAGLKVIPADSNNNNMIE